MLDDFIKVFDDYTKRGRMDDLETLAEEEGLPFAKKQSYEKQTTDIKGFKPFVKKGSKRLIGVLNIPVKFFNGQIKFYDYLRTRDWETQTYSIIEIYCNDLETEYFCIEPKGAIGKMKGLFVSEEKEFPELKDFYSKFRIITEVPEPESILRKSALQLMTEFPGITVEGRGNYFIFYYAKKEMKIHDIMKTIDFTEEMVRLLCFDDSDDYV